MTIASTDTVPSLPSNIRPTLQVAILTAVVAALPLFVNAQSNPQFNVSLRIDYSSAEEMLNFFDRQTFNAQRLADLHGNQIAAATSVMLARTGRTPSDFVHELELVRDNYTTSGDIYGLKMTQSHADQLRKLLNETRKRQLDRRIVATIESYFPSDARVSADIPVYVVAMGNEKAAAFVRRVVWQDNKPVFVGENEGEEVIVLNLTRMLGFGQKVDQQFIQVLSTLAHECFHAVFGAYQDKSTVWTDIHRRPEPIWTLAGLVQNEGIAYCLSLQLQIGGQTPPAPWFDATSNAVRSFNSAAQELISPTISPKRARDLIMNSNLSGSFEGNYGATAGLRIAYEIDTQLGRQALTETISGGVKEFFGKYETLCRRNSNLPKLDSDVVRVLEE
jgi:hypothetical protein